MDVLHQVVAHIKASPLKIFLKLDKTTDVINLSQLIKLVRYMHFGTTMKALLFNEPPETPKQNTSSDV